MSHFAKRLFGQKSTVWTPPNAILWYYGDEMRNGKWMDRIGIVDGEIMEHPTFSSEGMYCGEDDWVKITSDEANTLLAGKVSMTFMCWVRGVDDWILAKKYLNTNNQWSAMNSVVKNARVRASLGNSVQAYANNAIFDNTWHHYATVFEVGQPIRIYIDGIDATSASSGVCVPFHEHNNNNEWVPVNPYFGTMDDVLFCDVALTQSQIQDVMKNSPASKI